MTIDKGGPRTDTTPQAAIDGWEGAAAATGRYDTPLDSNRLASEQATERARLCDRLETMWQGLQTDIQTQRDESERGVDPRLQQLQLQAIKLQMTLWRMTGTPLPEPPAEVDPEVAAIDARRTATAALERVTARLAAEETGKG